MTIIDPHSLTRTGVSIGRALPLAADKHVYLTDREVAALARRAVGPHAPNAAPFGGAQDRPIALLGRQVATASLELLWFTRRARRLGYRPVVLEHRSDRFCVHNAYKRSLLTMPIIVGRDRHGRMIIEKHRLHGHDAAEGRPLLSLGTESGENLVDYHHRRMRDLLGADAPDCVDISSVLATAGQGAGTYYRDLFKLLSGPVVLFEDFVVDRQTRNFFDRVVAPAFDEVALETGRWPQIARLTPRRWASWSFWNAYPSSLGETARRRTMSVKTRALAAA